MGWRDRAIPAEAVEGASGGGAAGGGWRSRAIPAEQVEHRTAVQDAAKGETEGIPDQDESLFDKLAARVPAIAKEGSFGFAPRAAAAIDTVTGDTHSGENYAERAKHYEDTADQAVKEYPGTAIAAGMLAPMPGGKVKALGTVGNMALHGGVAGLLSGAGHSKADSLADVAKDAGTEGLVGTGVGGALGGLGKLAEKYGPDFVNWLRDKAANRMTKAAGFIQKDLNKLPEGAGTKIGRQLLDAGLNKPGRSTEELLPGFKAAKKATGAEIGGLLDQADAASGGPGAAYEPLKHGIDPERLDIAKDGMRSLDPFRRKYEDAVTKGINPSDFAASGMGEKLPIRINVDSEGNAVLTDGRHRLAAAQEAGADKILSRVLHYDGEGNAVNDVTGALPLGPRKPGFDLKQFTDAVRAKVLPELDDPALTTLKSYVENILEGYDQKAAQGVGFAEANRMKSNLQKTISKFVEAPISQEAKLKLQGLLDDTIESQMGKVLGPEGLEKFKDAKSKYGALAETVKAARGAEKRNLGNRAVSLTDHLVGLGGIGAAGGALGGHGLTGGALGAGAALLNHMARHRGASAAAAALDTAADVAGSKFAGWLRQALQTRGVPGFLAAHQALKSNPNYPADDVEAAILNGGAAAPASGMTP